MCPTTNDTTTTSGTTTNTNPSERNSNNHHNRTTEHRPSHRRHHSSGDNRNINNNNNSHSTRSLLADAAITAAAAVTASDHHHTILLDMDEHLQLLLLSPPPSSSRRPSNTMITPPAPISSRILLVDDLETNPNHHDDDAIMMMKHHPYHHEDGCIEATIASSPSLVKENEAEDQKDDIISTNRMDTNNMSWLSRMMEYIKYIYSTLLLLFSIAVVMYAICTQQTVATSSTLNIYIAILFFWICIVWLAIMEGTQGAVVGLQSVESHLYHTSHPRTFQNTQLIYQNHKNNNNISTEDSAAASTPTTSNNSSSNDNNHNRLERFIIGRQFLVVLVVFILNTLSSSIPGATLFVKDDGTSFMNMITTIFLDNGVATILITIIIGQLIAQIVSSNCMLDFMNNYLVYGTEHISLLIESSGLLHAVYLFQIFFTTSAKSKNPKSPSNHNKNVNHDTDNNNHISVSQHEGSISMASFSSFSVSPPPTWSQTIVVVLSNTFFWLRVLLSVAILVFSFAVTITALVQNQTKMWDGVPISISIILFIILMMIVGMLEGLQIALFAVIRRTDLEHDHPMAYKNSQLILSKAQNLPAFLIGRQILVTGCTFIVARITAVDVDVEKDTNIFGVSDSVQYFFNTGLLGAVITTIMASLIWRIIAASYPVAFLSNPIVYILIRSCLYLEMSGICSSAWILAYLHKKLMNYKNDEVYIGSNNKSDDTAVEQHVNSNDKNCNNDLDLEENTPTPYH